MSKNVPEVGKETLLELWMAGRNQKFDSGDVVRAGADGTGNIGVVRYSEKDYKIYAVKWHTGSPNKWDGVEGTCHEDAMMKVDEPNPMLVPSWERYPGPSSDEIKRLKTRMAARQDEIRKADAEKRIQALEEDIKRKKSGFYDEVAKESGIVPSQEKVFATQTDDDIVETHDIDDVYDKIRTDIEPDDE